MLNLKDEKILITGGRGFLGTHLQNMLLERGVPKGNILLSGRENGDLREKQFCEIIAKNISVIFHLAANFDGLKYNTEHAAEVFYDNAAMGLNLVDAAYKAGVKKFILAGTVGSYPKNSPIPYKENEYWNGLPETGNDSYGLSKKMVAAQLMAYRQQYGFVGLNLILGNMYGPFDHFDPNKANVIPAMIHKFLDAKKENKEITMWGTGDATREFLYVEDAAEALCLAAEKYDNNLPVNIGTGDETTIRKMTEMLAKIVGFNGEIVWDKAKPEGQKRRVMDVSLANQKFGFKANTKLEEGLQKTYKWYLEHYEHC